MSQKTKLKISTLVGLAKKYSCKDELTVNELKEWLIESCEHCRTKKEAVRIISGKEDWTDDDFETWYYFSCLSPKK